MKNIIKSFAKGIVEVFSFACFLVLVSAYCVLIMVCGAIIACAGLCAIACKKLGGNYD